jgi:DNA repair exonuclease SbcCD ATPase subunit
MNLTHLQLTGVLTHANTQLDVPARGVVLVLGANGSGKSALVESVALAAWGKSLRGTPVWAGENGSVTVTTDTLRIERMRKNNRAALQWSLLGASAPTYDTASKAQAALDNAIIPFDVWRRTHVFSSSDAAHFALASDAERKRLLESVLGLAKFDAARERARVELRAAERTLAETEGYLKACHAELSRVAERGKDAEARRDAAENCEKGPDCCTLQNHADRYKLPWQDRTIYFDEKNQRVVQMASGDRLVKEHIRRAFCRLVMAEMHKLNIEINIVVV